MRPATARFPVLLMLFAVAQAFLSAARGDEWPQWRGPARDGVWRETGVLDAFPESGLQIAWRQPIGPGYNGPTVADGRVVVMDRVAASDSERVLCFDAKTGRPLWKHEYPAVYRNIGYTAGPRACVTLHAGRAYALGAMGHVRCLDAATGEALWKRDLNADYKINMPIWGVAAAPLVFENLLILQIGGEKACVAALSLTDGRDVWKALEERASYAAPILVAQAGEPIVVCWTGDSLAGLAPRTGETRWRREFKPSRMPIGIATPIVDEAGRLFVTSFYDGALMTRLRADRPAIDELWRKVGRDERHTEALHSIISTPLFLGEHVYGVDSYGELRCLEAETGKRVWEDLTATRAARWSNIHFVRNGDRVWMFNEEGVLTIAKLSPTGYQALSRAKLLEPTLDQLRQRGGVCWSHPAFAYKHVFARNDKELVCASLEAK